VKAKFVMHKTKAAENNFGDGMHILTTRKIEDNLHMSPAHCSNTDGLAIHPNFRYCK
jgi:hypothetical protein